MEDVTIQTALEFGFKAKTIKKTKYMYICRNNKDIRIIKKTNASCEKLMFIHELKEYLYKSGFEYTDRFCISSQNTPYFTDSNATYTMTYFPDYPEADLSLIPNAIKVVSSCAAVHKASDGFAASSSVIPQKTDLFQKFEKGIKKLNKFKKLVKGKKQLSSFDILFIKTFQYYIEEALEALEMLKKYNINTEKKFSFCHNSLKEDNILIGKTGTYIINFDNTTSDTDMVDLSYIIKRYMRKHGEEFLGIEKILDVYSKIKHISDDEICFLYALLKYPSRYIKICDTLYSKRGVIVPNASMHQLEEIISVREKSRDYLLPITQAYRL